jgi:ABC-type transporter Mla subunit MlaD
MNRTQIDRVTAGVPAGVDPHHRRRLEGYAATARRCEDRLTALRAALERAQRAVDDAVAADDARDAAADEALRVAQEIDALERIQPRVDAWLRVTAGTLSTSPDIEPFGEGPS